MIDASRSRTLGFAALVLLLVALGCARPLLPEGIRTGWSGLVLGTAAAAALAGALRARALRACEPWLLALLPLALAALYLQPQRIASDGVFYYAPLRSVVVDFDLDFENEYRVLGAEPGYFQRTSTGRLPNNWSVGPAILWAPFFLVAHGLALLGLYRPTGFGYPYFTAVATGTALLGFAGVVLLFRLLRAYFDEGVALLAALLVWLATFHVWYMVFEPSMSHALAMASVTAFLLYSHEGLRGTRQFAVMGALGGLVALIRWQNVLYLPVALVTSYAAHRRPRALELLAGGAAFALAFAPQLFYWRALYGSFFLVPQGGGYLDWSSPEIEGLLFSSRHGLFAWAPVLYLGVAGLAGFLRRAPAFGWALVVSALAALYVNASVHDWWGGASFGARRFDGALPLLALGLATTLGWLRRQIEGRPLVALAALVAPFVVWNGLLMGVYFEGAIPPDGPASFRQAAADGLELVYRWTGYPFSWPAALPEAAEESMPIAAYDLAGARTLSNNVDIRMGETDALFLGRGWSLPQRGRERTFREVSPAGAEIYVSLREPAPYTLAVEGAPGGRAAVVVNGSGVGTIALERGGAVIEVPSEAMQSGLNRLSLIPEPGAGALRISRLSLTRPGELGRK